VAVAYAQKMQKVTATYTYFAPENVTLEEAKRTALDRAKLTAIADAFGTLVTQSNSTLITNQNGETDSRFFSLGGSEVKGEWIETTKEPVYEVKYEGNMLIVSVEVEGRIREIVGAGIDFQAHVLRNGTDNKYESDVFKSGDDLYLSFRTPVNGYLAIYLVDAQGQAYCLLPYRSQTDGIYTVKANQRYLFFSTKEAIEDERSMVDEYVMTCERESEHNQIYVIFSPKPFMKAVDRESVKEITDDAIAGFPRELSSSEFRKWLAKTRAQDQNMSVNMIPITIKK
jgi:hypothetical protein